MCCTTESPHLYTEVLVVLSFLQDFELICGRTDLFYLQSYFMRTVIDKMYYECHKGQLFYMGYKSNELITPCFHQYPVLEVSQVKI